MLNKTTVYKANSTTVTPVKCKTPGWPNLDENGDTMFDYWCFATEAEAWERVLAEAKARLESLPSDIIMLREALAAAEIDLAEGEKDLRMAKENHRKWEANQD